MPWAKPFTLVVGAVAFLAVAWALWFVLQSNEQLLSFVFNGQPTYYDQEACDCWCAATPEILCRAIPWGTEADVQEGFDDPEENLIPGR